MGHVCALRIISRLLESSAPGRGPPTTRSVDAIRSRARAKTFVTEWREKKRAIAVGARYAKET